MMYTWGSSVLSDLVYATHLPSGDHSTPPTAEPPKVTTSPLVSTSIWLFSSVYLCSFLSLEVYSNALLSGDQEMLPFCVSLSETFFIWPPFSSHSQTSSRPL